MIKVIFRRTPGGFPETKVFFPTGFSPLVVAKEFARTEGVELLAIETTGKDGRIRRYNMKVVE